MVECELLIHDFGQDVGIFGVKEEILVHHIFLVHALQNLLQPNVPDHEEEPVAYDKFPFPPKRNSLFKVFGHIGDWLAMRSVLLQVSQKVVGLASIN